MLIARKLISADRQNEKIKQITGLNSDNQLYRVQMDNSVMLVKLINQKITSVSKSSIISEFLTMHKTQPKIIVVTGISPKAQNILQSETYPNTEIFLAKELLINIIDHISVPKYTLLTDDEAKEVIHVYHAKKKDLPKQLVFDPISKYYNAKPGQMFRIVRPSETAGEVATYRLVVKGQIKTS